MQGSENLKEHTSKQRQQRFQRQQAVTCLRLRGLISARFASEIGVSSDETDDNYFGVLLLVGDEVVLLSFSVFPTKMSFYF